MHGHTCAFQSVQLLFASSREELSRVFSKMISFLRKSRNWRCEEQKKFQDFEVRFSKESEILWRKSGLHRVMGF